jgi:hypothetical protein
MGDLAEGMDAGVSAAGASQVHQVLARLVEGMLQTARHGAYALPRLLGALPLPALEAASVIFEQQPESGYGRRFQGHVRAR